MNNDIVGRRYIATGAPSTVWVVSHEVLKNVKFPHALLHNSGEPRITKLIAVNALEDDRLYRMVK